MPRLLCGMALSSGEMCGLQINNGGCPMHGQNGMDVTPHDPKVDYYRWHASGLQAKDITCEFPANLAIAVNYIWRVSAPPHVRKPGSDRVRDLKAAIDHIKFEIERIEKGHSK